MKGKKTFLLYKQFNFLGHVVANGQIRASPHRVDKIRIIKHTDIITVKQMESFLGMCLFLSRFMIRSQDVFSPLRLAVKGHARASTIDWTPALIDSFDRAKLALNELIANHPFIPKLRTVVVVDTSRYGTGGILYQIHFIDGRQTPKIIRTFHRVKKGAEKNLYFSSCLMELNGLLATVTAFWPYLESAQLHNPVTIVTDNKPVMLIFRKLKNNEMPSDNASICKILWDMRRLWNANVVHSKNTGLAIGVVDAISRDFLDIADIKHECGGPKDACTVCRAAG